VADGSVDARFMLGVTFEAIADGAEGYVTLVGQIAQVDTNGFAVGTVLWLSATTPGTFTTTRPVSPNLAISAAIVTRQNSSSGRLFVRMWEQQADLGDLHDVLLTSPTAGQVIKRNSSGLWVNSAISTGLTWNQLKNGF
jgi:hypothetical protein